MKKIWLYFYYYSENRIQREHDTAVQRLFDWLTKFEKQLNETLASIKDFHTKDRLSESKTYLNQLDDLQIKVLEFLDEVSRTRLACARKKQGRCSDNALTSHLALGLGFDFLVR